MDLDQKLRNLEERLVEAGSRGDNSEATRLKSLIQQFELAKEKGA
jgi:hypothetical protein